MKTIDYERYFNSILTCIEPFEPYDNPQMLHYAQLNKTRHDRWMKKGELLSETIEDIQAILNPLKWILITEPWCGDAAHTVPFIFKMVEQSKLIELEIRLRDSLESEIEHYLTNGSKAIPILIVRNEQGKDLFKWGPRPKAAQKLRQKLHDQGTDANTIKIELQKWYNKDEGESVQKELCLLLEKAGKFI